MLLVLYKKVNRSLIHWDIMIFYSFFFLFFFCLFYLEYLDFMNDHLVLLFKRKKVNKFLFFFYTYLSILNYRL